MIPLGIILPLIVFWLWMFDDMLKNDTLPGIVTRDPKTDWAVAFVLLNVFAAVFYYALVYRYRPRR